MLEQEAPSTQGWKSSLLSHLLTAVIDICSRSVTSFFAHYEHEKGRKIKRLRAESCENASKKGSERRDHRTRPDARRGEAFPRRERHTFCHRQNTPAAGGPFIADRHTACTFPIWAEPCRTSFSIRLPQSQHRAYSFTLTDGNKHAFSDRKWSKKTFHMPKPQFFIKHDALKTFSMRILALCKLRHFYLGIHAVQFMVLFQKFCRKVLPTPSPRKFGSTAYKNNMHAAFA